MDSYQLIPWVAPVWQPIPAAHAVELPQEEGWRQWDLAVQLQDKPQ